MNRSARSLLGVAAVAAGFEIIGGRIAESHAGSVRVQHLGARLVKDHKTSLHEAIALAKRLGISVPSDPSTTEEWELAGVSALERKDLPTLRYHLHRSKLAWWAST